ncbi:MAG: D-alanyl-D-alanine carboxypeptidase/D-alanyl-D-alanine-endopeptidase [Actinomycetes bacterium]
MGTGIVGPLSALTVNDGWGVSPVPPAAGGGPVDDPPAHAASVLTAQLRARGVVVDGMPSARPPGAAAPAGTARLARVASLPVSELVGEMLAFSDNTTAEMLLREVGRTSSGTASTEAGAAAATDWLGANGYAAAGAVVQDGSGLSADNRLTCNQVADLLQRAGPTGAVADGLAVPGRPGTLRDRLLAARFRPAVRAKTGTLNTVTALSGWVRTAPGRNLVFAVLENTSGRNVGSNELAVQSRLLDSVLPYPELPPRDQVVPRPARGR